VCQCTCCCPEPATQYTLFLNTLHPHPTHIAASHKLRTSVSVQVLLCSTCHTIHTLLFTLHPHPTHTLQPHTCSAPVCRCTCCCPEPATQNTLFLITLHPHPTHIAASHKLRTSVSVHVLPLILGLEPACLSTLISHASHAHSSSTNDSSRGHNNNNSSAELHSGSRKDSNQPESSKRSSGMTNGEGAGRRVNATHSNCLSACSVAAVLTLLRAGRQMHLLQGLDGIARDREALGVDIEQVCVCVCV